MEPIRTLHCYPDPETGPLVAWITTALVNGRPMAIGVEIWSVDPSSLPKEITGLEPAEAKRHWQFPLLRGIRKQRGIESKDLRLPLQKLVGEDLAHSRATSEMLRYVSENSEPDHWTRKPEVQDHLRELLDGPPIRRQGRPPLPPSHYLRVAKVYTDAVRNGDDPTEAVRNDPALGGPVSKNAAAKWVYRCRRAPYELLPPTVRGRSAASQEFR